MWAANLHVYHWRKYLNNSDVIGKVVTVGNDMGTLQNYDFFAQVTDWNSTLATQGVYCLYGHHTCNWDAMFPQPGN
eukprot:12920057-Prorocentrum_lima.AAC.1